MDGLIKPYLVDAILNDCCSMGAMNLHKRANEYLSVVSLMAVQNGRKTIFCKGNIDWPLARRVN